MILLLITQGQDWQWRETSEAECTTAGLDPVFNIFILCSSGVLCIIFFKRLYYPDCWGVWCSLQCFAEGPGLASLTLSTLKATNHLWCKWSHQAGLISDFPFPSYLPPSFTSKITACWERRPSHVVFNLFASSFFFFFIPLFSLITGCVTYKQDIQQKIIHWKQDAKINPHNPWIPKHPRIHTLIK
jgi:hypothetical protein